MQSLPTTPPQLVFAEAEDTVLAADEILRGALAGEGADPLFEVFRGAALTALRLQVARLTARGVRIEERDITRWLAHFDPARAEAVLAVAAEHRLATNDAGNQPWAATERQWWTRLAFADGAWWITEQRILSPDDWYPA